MSPIKDHWLTAAKHCLSPHFNERPDPADISLLVIHNISLPPRQFGGAFIEDFFLGKLTSTAHPFFDEIREMQVSAHCLIKRDGSVVQFVPFNQRAWHAGISCFEGREKCNDFSIGIELEGCDDLPYESAQYQSLITVTQQLMASYPQLTPERITGHCDIAPERKTDPGEAFNWSYFFAELTKSIDSHTHLAKK